MSSIVLIYDVSANITIGVHLGGITGNATINWGDGSTTTASGASISESIHTYSTAGVYTVTISGSRILYLGTQNNNAMRNISYLTAVSSFGDVGLTGIIGAFLYARNLVSMPSTIPSTITNLAYVFNNCSKLNDPNISNWNVSNVTNMEFLFAGSAFNQNISNWDVRNVTNMGFMFSDAQAFNQNIGNWNVSNVTSMKGMFLYANAFNQSLNSWDFSKVTQTDSMFNNSRNFNNGGVDVSWNTLNVSDMDRMFANTSNFNVNINRLDVSKVENMSNMFQNAINFNNGGVDLSWNTLNVISMVGMFQNAGNFNVNVNRLNVSKVQSFDRMFQNATKFNNGQEYNVSTSPITWTLNTTPGCSISMGYMF